MGIADTNILCFLCFIAGELLAETAGSAAAGAEGSSAAGTRAHVEAEAETRPLRLVLADRGIVYDGVLRLRRAFFGYGCVLNENYAGVLHLNEDVLGVLRLGGKVHVMRGESAEKTYANDLAILERPERHTTSIRLLLISDAGRTARLGSCVFGETMDIFRNASRIFEAEDWGKHKVRLKLSNIFCIERGLDAPRMHRRRRVGQRVPSDSTEDEGGSGGQSVQVPSTRQRVLRTRRCYKEKLAGLANTFASILSEIERKDEFSEQQDVVFLVSDEKSRDIEGLSYDGCAFGQGMCFGIVLAGGSDDGCFLGRVLAHELGHVLGAPHDAESGFLMEAAGSESTRHTVARMSDGTKLAIAQFLESRGRIPA